MSLMIFMFWKDHFQRNSQVTAAQNQERKTVTLDTFLKKLKQKKQKRKAYETVMSAKSETVLIGEKKCM